MRWRRRRRSQASPRARTTWKVAAPLAKLGIAALDNDLARAAAIAAGSCPALLVDSNGEGRACVTLAENRFADGGAGASAVALRLRETRAVSVGGCGAG